MSGVDGTVQNYPALAVHCPRCQAVPERWCRDTLGFPSGNLHRQRFDRMMEIDAARRRAAVGGSCDTPEGNQP